MSVAWAEAATRTRGDFLIRRASSSGARTTAAAPSVIGEQSRMRSGSATSTDSSTCSAVTGVGNWASGFIEPCRWFLTATSASCRRVVPWRCMWARAIMA